MVVFLPSSLLQCCNLLLVETLKDPLCFKVSDQTIPKQQHIVQVSVGGKVPQDGGQSPQIRSIKVMSESLYDRKSLTVQ